MSNDLKCNETLAMEDADKSKESVVRRVPLPQSVNHSAFRTNFSPTSHSVKYTIQKPASRQPYPVTSVANHVGLGSESSAHGAYSDTVPSQLQSVQHDQFQGGAKLYRQASSLECHTPSGYSRSQLEYMAGAEFLRNAVVAANRREQGSSSSSTAHSSSHGPHFKANTIQENPYSSYTSSRFDQLQQSSFVGKPSSSGSFAATHSGVGGSGRTSVEHGRHGAYHPHVMCKSLVPQLQQASTSSARPVMTLTPHVVSRPSQNGLKPASNLSPLRTAPHSLLSHHAMALPSRISGTSPGFYGVPPSPLPCALNRSPGPPVQNVQQMMSTPSPRPSILRKRGDVSGGSGAAKRRLPFSKEESSSPNSSTQPSAPSSSSAGAPHTLLQAKESANGTESPRKRMRKQKFETEEIPDQIKMAINVPLPGIPEIGGFEDDTRYSIITKGVGQKRKRGRPRTRPATVQPVHMQQSVSVFVDIDSPEEKKKYVATDRSSIRSSTASVPPVHLEAPKDQTNEKEDDPKKSFDDKEEHHSMSTKECVDLLKQWQREKIKAAKAARASKKHKLQTGVASLVSSPNVLTEEEQQTEWAVSLLAKWRRQRKLYKRRRRQQKHSEAMSSTSNHFFDTVPTNSGSSNAKKVVSSAAPKSIASAADTCANHFENDEEFNESYQKYRRLQGIIREHFNFTDADLRKAAEVILSTPLRPAKEIDVTLKNAKQICKGRKFDHFRNVLKERLKQVSEKYAAGCSRLPVVSCKINDVQRSRSNTVEDVVVEKRERSEAEQVVDEMISFVASDESPTSVAECAERNFLRNATGRCVGKSGRKRRQSFFAGRKARARVLMEDSFDSLLRNVEAAPEEHDSLTNGVELPRMEHQARGWWGLVCSKHEDRIHPQVAEHPRVTSLAQPLSNSSVSGCERSSSQSPVENSSDLTIISLRREMASRIETINRRVNEQILLEERVLNIFERFYKVYNPKEYWNMKLDMQRDIRDDDSEATRHQKRLRRLRYVLMLPPGKLGPDKKLDFGDHCGSIITCPNEGEMNEHMLGLSPFWRGPMTNNSNTSCYYSKSGRLMRDKYSSYVALEDDYKEYYLEDLKDIQDRKKAWSDYGRMKEIWAQIKDIKIHPLKSDSNANATKGEWISRRKLARLKDENVVCLGSTEANGLRGRFDGEHEIDEELAQRGESLKEILATSFKALRQTTLIMMQSRDAILELVHKIVEGKEDDDEEQDSVDEDDCTNRVEQAVQESFQELQSSSKVQA